MLHGLPYSDMAFSNRRREMFLPSKEADLALAARIKAADKHRCARQPNENANPFFVEDRAEIPCADAMVIV